MLVSHWCSCENKQIGEMKVTTTSNEVLQVSSEVIIYRADSLPGGFRRLTWAHRRSSWHFQWLREVLSTPVRALLASILGEEDHEHIQARLVTVPFR